MKLTCHPVSMLMTVACGLLVACSRPKEVNGDAQASPSEQSPTPRVADPWKVAADWPVPRGPVGDAQRFLLNAPAYQCTYDGEDLDAHRRGHGTIRVVRNQALAMECGGAYGEGGIITDGKREFVLFQGRYGQEPGDASATLLDQLGLASLQSLLNDSEAYTPLVGAEKVNGVEAEVYAFTARQSDPRPPMWAVEGGHLRIWIAKDNHRPLKVEQKEDYHFPQNPGKTHAAIEVKTYAYDPNVKVALPVP